MIVEGLVAYGIYRHVKSKRAQEQGSLVPDGDEQAEPVDEFDLLLGEDVHRELREAMASSQRQRTEHPGYL